MNSNKGLIMETYGEILAKEELIKEFAQQIFTFYGQFILNVYRSDIGDTVRSSLLDVKATTNHARKIVEEFLKNHVSK